MILPLTGTFGMAIKTLLVVDVVASISDPAWATPINTGLLIVLVVVSGHNGKRLISTEHKIEEARDTATSAASAAASAATAAADAARITKEIGGALRHVEPPT